LEQFYVSDEERDLQIEYLARGFPTQNPLSPQDAMNFALIYIFFNSTLLEENHP